MLVFACLLLLLVLLSLFSLVFISGQNFISSSKDTIATTTVAKLILRALVVSLLLTLKVVIFLKGTISPIKFYRAVVNTRKDFNQWLWPLLVKRLSKIFSANHNKWSTKQNINETNTFKANSKNTSVISNIVDFNTLYMFSI